MRQILATKKSQIRKQSTCVYVCVHIYIMLWCKESQVEKMKFILLNNFCVGHTAYMGKRYRVSQSAKSLAYLLDEYDSIFHS